MPRRLTFPALPPGPHRELLLFLFELQRLAGEPATRTIAEGVVESAEQRVRCSHTTVHKLLTGHQLPTNGDLVFEIAKWLNGRNRHRPQDEEMLLDRLEDLWRAAQRYEALAPTGLRTAPQVFISYAQDSAEHRDSVVRFAELLLRNGVDVRLDQWDQGIRRDWSRWVVDQLMTADFVLVVASPGYRDVAQGAANSSKGRGASFEAAVLRDSLLRDRAFHFRRILPVVLPGGSADDIPLFLQPYTGDHYRVTEFNIEGAEALLRTLFDQPAIVPPSLGQVPTLPAMLETVEVTPRVSQERSPLLPDLGTSWAVMVGVAGYRPLPALPQVAGGLGELRRLLTDGSESPFRADRTSALLDPTRSDLLDAVAEAVDRAEDTLLLYFAGHGLVSRRGDLLLATVDTRPDADYTAVSYDSVRDLLSAGRAKRSAVVLDCCFSGRALESMGHLDGLAEVPGTFVLTATSGNAAAFAPTDRPYPVFTGALLDLLTTGEPGAGEYLTMDRIYHGVRRRALEQGFPVPQQMARGGRELALIRNPAFRPQQERRV